MINTSLSQYVSLSCSIIFLKGSASQLKATSWLKEPEKDLHHHKPVVQVGWKKSPICSPSPVMHLDHTTPPLCICFSCHFSQLSSSAPKTGGTLTRSICCPSPAGLWRPHQQSYSFISDKRWKQEPVWDHRIIESSLTLEKTSQINSPTIYLAPWSSPLNHIPSCHIHTSV